MILHRESNICKQNYNSCLNSDYLTKGLLLKNKDKLSFKERSTPSEKTIQYLHNVKMIIQRKNAESISLKDLQLGKMMDICEGIPIFKSWSAVDLLYATNNIDSILLSRGCYKQCSHCGTDAMPKIKFMKWENFIELVDGIAILSERLGFNPFAQKGTNNIFCFHDSDPVDYRQVDEKGGIHTIYDAAKYFYDKTGSKFIITSAGWSPENKIAQKAMENFVENSKIITDICISIHPFHSFITKSIEFEKQGNPKKAMAYRKKYVDMMANVLKTLAPLAKKNKLFINLLYEDVSNKKLSDVTNKLFEEIYLKAKSLGTDLNFTNNTESIQNILNANFIIKTPILNEGKAKQLMGNTTNQHSKGTKVTQTNLLESAKYINIDGTILVAPNDTLLAANLVALPKKLKFSKAPVVYDDYSYPTINDSDLLDRFGRLARLVKKILHV